MFGSLRDELRCGLHVAVGDAIALLKQGAELADNPLDLATSAGALPPGARAPGADTNVEQRLQVPEVLVVGAEELLTGFGERNLATCV